MPIHEIINDVLIMSFPCLFLQSEQWFRNMGDKEEGNWSVVILYFGASSYTYGKKRSKTNKQNSFFQGLLTN